MQGQTEGLNRSSNSEKREADSSCVELQHAFLKMLRDYFESASGIDIRLSAVERDVSETKLNVQTQMTAIRNELHSELKDIKESLKKREDFDNQLTPVLAAYTKSINLKAKLGNAAIIFFIILALKSALPAPLVELFIKLAAG